MKTAVQAAWAAFAFAVFILALIGLESIGATEVAGYGVLGAFLLASVTWLVYKRD